MPPQSIRKKTAVVEVSDSVNQDRHMSSHRRLPGRNRKREDFTMRRVLVLSVIAVLIFVGTEQLFAATGTSVRGRVMDHNGRPVARAMVEFTIRHEVGAIVAYTTFTGKTDGDGRYVIEHLPVGCGLGNASAKCCGSDSKRVCLGGQTINIVNFLLH